MINMQILTPNEPIDIQILAMPNLGLLEILAAQARDEVGALAPREDVRRDNHDDEGEHAGNHERARAALAWLGHGGLAMGCGRGAGCSLVEKRKGDQRRRSPDERGFPERRSCGGDRR